MLLTCTIFLFIKGVLSVCISSFIFLCMYSYIGWAPVTHLLLTYESICVLLHTILHAIYYNYLFDILLHTPSGLKYLQHFF